jgi:hypothetical protein
MYDVREKVERYMQDQPFIVFYVGGESTYSKETWIKYSNISFNSMIVSQLEGMNEPKLRQEMIIG